MSFVTIHDNLLVVEQGGVVPVILLVVKVRVHAILLSSLRVVRHELRNK
jgi:hypothetical protein